jgi:superfamily II DNA/RNA helicase
MVNKPNQTGSSRSGDARKMRAPKVSTSKREEAEIKTLDARATELPAAGDTDLLETEFKALPLSRYTLTGLDKSRFTIMTQIQRVAIPHALAG